MKVLFQEIDRYGSRPVKSKVIFLNDGPSSFKQGGKLDKELVKEVFLEAIGEELEDEFFRYVQVRVDKEGNSVLMSGEETDYIFTNVDVLIED